LWLRPEVLGRLPGASSGECDCGGVLEPGFSTQRNFYLDVIRAAAIIEVLLHHLDLFLGTGTPEWLPYAFHAPVGVQLFLVLSGWLLGGQLFRGLGRDGRIDLARFWGRRWLRTLPAYYAVLALRMMRGGGGRSWTAGMIVFAQNYTAPEAWVVSWSLCVQEHFYLALPLVLLLVARRPRLGVVVGLGFLLLPPLFRWLAYRPSLSEEDFFALIEAPTHMRLDGVVVGVLLAALSGSGGPAWTWCRRQAPALALVGVATIAAIALSPWPFDPVRKVAVSAAGCAGGYLGLSLGAAMLIPATVVAKSLGRRWWHAPTTWIADHAYALYLLHTSVYGLVQPMGRRLGLSLLATTIVMVVASLCAAWVLRTVVEKPVLRARDRLFARPATTSQLG
jgi:peptidoglycan/LPS O-acetylase OafA/YrhL